MKVNGLMKKVLGVVFGLSLLLGIGMTASTPVNAQYRDSQWQREQEIRRQRQWEREQRRRQRQAQRDWRYDRDGRYDGRNEDNYSNYGGYEFRQTALNAGYNEGIKEGRKDRNNGDRFDYRDEEDFRNANTGYSSRFRDRQLYAQYFREAFINGYTDGYRGY